MKLVLTTHVKRRYLERILEKKVREAYLIPPEFVVRLGIVRIPLGKIKEKRFYYAYHFKQNEFFYLKLDGDELVVTSYIVPEKLLEEDLKDLIKREKLRKVKEMFSGL